MGSKDIRIIEPEFVAKAQFLYLQLTMNGELVQHDSASSTATISTTAEVHSDKLNKLESTGNTTKEARSMESDGSEVGNSDLEVGIPDVDVGNADSEVGNCGSEVENTGPEVGNSDPEVGNSGGNGFTDHSAIIFESRTKGIMKESGFNLHFFLFIRDF